MPRARRSRRRCCRSSPTFHSAAVIELIRGWRPHVVIFDNAGRTAQLRAARRSGARVVYISARRRQRRKAFRWRWMPLIDEHWIAYPEFIAGKLGVLERFKLQAAAAAPACAISMSYCRAPRRRRRGAHCRGSGCEAQRYVLIVPGGGTGHPGRARCGGAISRGRPRTRGQRRGDGVRRAARAADAGARRSAPAAAESAHLGALPQPDLAELMRRARLVVANGGSTLLQAIACGARLHRGAHRAVIRPSASGAASQRGVAVDAALDARRIAARRSRAVGR